jgi:hypothetical protein
LLGPRETPLVTARTVGEYGNWEKVEHLIPELSAYTGKDTHSWDEVFNVMRDSLGAGLVSAARSAGRKGLFAADMCSGGRTKPVLEAMNGDHVRYHRNARVEAWPGQDKTFSPKGSLHYIIPGGMIVSRGTFQAGLPYTNPNTGRVVCMSSFTSEDITPTPDITQRRIPEQERAKFDSMDFAHMCPQGLFHN